MGVEGFVRVKVFERVVESFTGFSYGDVLNSRWLNQSRICHFKRSRMLKMAVCSGLLQKRQDFCFLNRILNFIIIHADFYGVAGACTC